MQLRDPVTGKIKPVYLIAGGGIVIFGVILLLGKGGGSSTNSNGSGSSGSGGGVISGGQSSDITQQLAELNDAIIGLSGGELPAAPGGNGNSNVPSNNTNTSPYYDDPNTYPVIGTDPFTSPIGFGPEVPIIDVAPLNPKPSPTPTPIKTITYTEQQALDAIKARAIASGYSGSASSVKQTYQQDLAKGYTLEQIVTAGGSTSKVPAPTQAQLDAIKARATAAGFNPTPQAILNTYYRYA